MRDFFTNHDFMAPSIYLNQLGNKTDKVLWSNLYGYCRYNAKNNGGKFYLPIHLLGGDSQKKENSNKILLQRFIKKMITLQIIEKLNEKNSHKSQIYQWRKNEEA